MGLIVLLFILLTIQLFSSPSTTQTPQASLSPSLEPQNNLPSLPPSSQDIPPAAYEPAKLNQDYQRIINRQPVSSSDQTVRTNLINSVANQTGILEQSNDFIIEYVKAPDAFMIQILTDDTESAKTAAQNWFKQQGLSDSGICNLPIVFYLSRSVSASLVNRNMQFDPIPKGCQ